MDVIEVAILDHAQQNSDWWQQNREHLCFHHEGALCYFAIRAFTISPQLNLELIGRLLCDKNLLEFELSFELAALIQASFIYLDQQTQAAVMATIQTVWEDSETEGDISSWTLKKRAEYISAIPCHLRSKEVQAVLDTFEKQNGAVIRQPTIRSRGGTVVAPFSFEVFINTNDDGVIRLLNHYSEYHRGFDDFLIGGKDEVGRQLREAASRHPTRFLGLLKSHWINIPLNFTNDIMDGIATYLEHSYGNLKASDKWTPIEQPDAPTLANQVLDELQRHSAHWRLNRSAANALEGCAHVIEDTQNAARLVFMAISYGYKSEETTIRGDDVDLLTAGINMKGGKVAEALMILANNLHERKIELPELLPPTLRLFASNGHPAIRALILRRLPYLQSQNSELGWEIFHRTTQYAEGLWESAERCLYYAYHDNFERIAPSLERIRYEGSDKDKETWGRISALSALTGHIEILDLIDDLKVLDNSEAWHGAASVWTHTGNIRKHREQCFEGIKAGLQARDDHATAVARKVGNIFRENKPPIAFPIALIRRLFSIFENDSEDKHHRLYGFNEWLNTTSQRDPDLALAATEIYLAYVRRADPYFHDHDNHLVQLATRLFTEAEEREESDQGAMLERVVSVQDLLLSLGLNSINDWLKTAERQ